MNKFTLLKINIDEGHVDTEFNTKIIEDFYNDKQDFYKKVDKVKIIEFVKYILDLLEEGDK